MARRPVTNYDDISEDKQSIGGYKPDQSTNNNNRDWRRDSERNDYNSSNNRSNNDRGYNSNNTGNSNSSNRRDERRRSRSRSPSRRDRDNSRKGMFCFYYYILLTTTTIFSIRSTSFVISRQCLRLFKQYSAANLMHSKN